MVQNFLQRTVALTGSQRNSFLYADKEKKLPFILKKKDIRINRNMTAKKN